MFNRRSSHSALFDPPFATEPAPPPGSPVLAPAAVAESDDDQAGPGVGPMEWLSGQMDRATVAKQLYEVIDPEVGVNIVDLGLLYGLRVPEGQVLIQMTLTTPGCPLGGYIEDEIHRALWGMPGVENINVDIVWEPPWGPELMSEQGKRELGWI